MLRIVALVGSERAESAVVFFYAVLSDSLVVIEKCESTAAVGVGVEVEVKLLEGKIVLFDFIKETLPFIHC
jgi:hypothetical protein